MKKTGILIALASTVMFVSCGEKESKNTIGDGKIVTDKKDSISAAVETTQTDVVQEGEAGKHFKNEADSLSYALALYSTNEIMGRVKNTNYDLFAKGLTDVYRGTVLKGVIAEKKKVLEDYFKSGKFKTDSSKGSGTSEIKNYKDKLSYILGNDFGISFEQKFKDLNLDLLTKGIKDVEANTKLITNKEASDILNKIYGKMMVKEQSAWLEENKNKPGVQVTASGLQYKAIRMGDGPQPKATDKVKVHYRGTLISGKQFDSSYDRGQPASFGLNQVIKGWTEGLQLMKVGAKYEFYIPYNLGYGERGTRGIPPFSTLKFEVELLAIE